MLDSNDFIRFSYIVKSMCSAPTITSTYSGWWTKIPGPKRLKSEKNCAKRTLAVAHAQLISNSKFKIDICKILQNSTLDF